LRVQAGLKPDNIEVMDGLRERFFGKELELTNHAHGEPGSCTEESVSAVIACIRYFIAG